MGRLRSACIFFLMTTSCVIGAQPPWTKAREEAWYERCRAEAEKEGRLRKAQEAREREAARAARAARDAAEAESWRRFVNGIRSSGLLDILVQQMTKGDVCPLPGGSSGRPHYRLPWDVFSAKAGALEDGSSFKPTTSSGSA